MTTYVVVAVIGALIGYAAKIWEDLISEGRCHFIMKYKIGKSNSSARCEYRAGHRGPHRTRAPGYNPDFYKNTEHSLNE